MKAQATAPALGSLALANPAPPAPPKSLDQLGVPEQMALDIALRFLWRKDAISVTQLRKALKLCDYRELPD